MSEEKLYAVKNDEGDWADAHYIFGYGVLVTPDKTEREEYVKHNGGHVVTLIEEPEKVVLTKEQAKIVENAHVKTYPATVIYDSYEEDEELLMDAYVNGYTVAKEKKYNIKVPKKWSGDDKHYWSKEQDGSLTWACLINKDYMIPTYQFTESEIEHYGLQDCERVEINTEDKK